MDTSHPRGAVGATPGFPAACWSVETLYLRLAGLRANRARSALAADACTARVLAQSASALEDAAGALQHAANAFTAPNRPLAPRLQEQADALLLVAARCEAASDLLAITTSPKPTS